MSRANKPRVGTEFQRLADERIYDAQLDQWLKAGKDDATAYEEALRRLKSQIGAARRAILYPQQAEMPDALAQLDAAYQPPVVGERQGTLTDIDVSALEEYWGLIISDAANAALVLREAFEESRRKWRTDKSSAMRVQLRIRAERVLRALHYTLHALIYQLRARANVTGGVAAPPPGRPNDVKPATGQHNMVRLFAARQHLIERVTRSWGLTDALSRGELEATTALNYGMWSHEFLAISEDELGWGRFSRRIAVELRYQRHSFELRQRWKEIGSSPRLLSPFRVLWAMVAEAFKWVAGFGLKPVRFAVTAVLTLAVFTTLYCLNDAVLSIPLTLGRVGHNLYIAIVYLTSVGSDQVQRGFAPALVSVESIMGYFLLSVLAAMLFAWFTDR